MYKLHLFYSLVKAADKKVYVFCLQIFVYHSLVKATDKKVSALYHSLVKSRQNVCPLIMYHRYLIIYH